MNPVRKSFFAVYWMTCALVVIYVLQLLNTDTSKYTHLQQLSSNFQNYYQSVRECGCSRRFRYPPLEQIHDSLEEPALFTRLNSSCSDQGTFYQANQNVVTFSLFLNDNDKQSHKLEAYYTEGLLQNLKMMRSLYPGYSLRLYTNMSLEGASSKYCKLICTNPDLFWCNVRTTPSDGDLSGMVFRTWRFLVLGDPTVDVFLSRDLDSLLSAREAAVVKDWLAAGDKAISLMRDRRRGHNEPILAGMWQASNKLLGSRSGINSAGHLRERIIKLSKARKEHTYKSSDQKILNKVVFYPMAKDIVAYDCYNCGKWSKFTKVRPFPTQRLDARRDFVGNKVDFLGGRGNFNYSSDVCPLECRPEYGKDWLYC